MSQHIVGDRKVNLSIDVPIIDRHTRMVTQDILPTEHASLANNSLSQAQDRRKRQGHAT